MTAQNCSWKNFDRRRQNDEQVKKKDFPKRLHAFWKVPWSRVFRMTEVKHPQYMPKTRFIQYLDAVLFHRCLKRSGVSQRAIFLLWRYILCFHLKLQKALSV